MEPILSVSPTTGGWELRTAARVLLIPDVTMQLWAKRAGIEPHRMAAAGCCLQVNSLGEARGIGWPGAIG